MEWLVTPDGKYRIESLSPVTFLGAIEVIRVAFCQDEAICIGSEVNKNPTAQEELLELCVDAALDGVSVVAVAVDTGEVVAVAFNKIHVKSTDTSDKTFYEKFAEEHCTQASLQSFMRTMVDINERCNLFEKYGVDCSLEIMAVGTLREHRKQKLGTLLSKVSVDMAKKVKEGSISRIKVEDLGFKYSHLTNRKPINTYPKICQAMVTVEGSQKVSRVLNFTVHLTVPFSEYVFNGKTYAERIGNEAAFCQVVAFPVYREI